MKAFKDNAGRTWAVNLDVNAMRRVRTGAPYSLAGKAIHEVLTELSADPVLLCDVIYYIVKPEADARGVSLENFGKELTGEPFEEMVKALTDELVNFTPNSTDRERSRKVVEAMWNLTEKKRAAAGPMLEKAIEKAMTDSGPSSSSSPESSALTPAP